MSKRILLEDVSIIFKNFSGNPDRYNPNGGNRTFCVRIEDEPLALELIAEGWNVSELPQSEEDDILAWKLPVKVNFDSLYPPELHAIYPTTMRDLVLSQTTAGLLDTSRIVKADVQLNGREWEPGRLKAYLTKLYATIDETPLDIKYSEYTRTG